ncbi:MAG: hypothetical protein A2666_02695 [Parcubacteria group bacterium RIFCSPHIGHO2_01_FULL_47_10b]|nr:MAG: hypothetical protein A3F05_00305 [Candidatus Saccharibacteria bacterium RIFCSPHIGHO2_12_FULL_47_17]OHB19179.1 MAG: hypothetical protein A2666_02695 [Parcubacteria group bacterium RIFCSPHIGHO2_01_FULL_47_10b]
MAFLRYALGMGFRYRERNDRDPPCCYMPQCTESDLPYYVSFWENKESLYSEKPALAAIHSCEVHFSGLHPLVKEVLEPLGFESMKLSAGAQLRTEATFEPRSAIRNFDPVKRFIDQLPFVVVDKDMGTLSGVVKRMVNERNEFEELEEPIADVVLQVLTNDTIRVIKMTLRSLGL